MRLPALFVSHGAPTLALEDGADARFLAALPDTFATPRALLLVSAHWQTRKLCLGCADVWTTLHDFAGFPASLDALSYPAQGSAPVADEVAKALAAAGIEHDTDVQRGLDHGAWVPLLKMWPDARVPVITLSLPYGAGASELLALGAALSSLPDKGVLVMGSGGYVHNLAALAPDGSAPPDWAQAFAAWMDDAILNGKRDALAHWQQQAPNAQQAHPSTEHLAPLFVALGAGGQDAAARKRYENWRYGSLSMGAFSFG